MPRISLVAYHKRYFIKMEHDHRTGNVGSCCIVNYGNESAGNIASCLGFLGIDYHIVPWEKTVSGEHICNSPFCIISGGPLRVCKRDNRYNLSKHIFGKRILAICYGMQLLCWNAGGNVSHLEELQKGVYGKYAVQDNLHTQDVDRDAWWLNMEYIRREIGWYNRLDYVRSVPEIVCILSLDTCGYISSCYIPEYDAYCVHNHPESPRCLDLELFREFFGIR
jgi:anthranilate/para-aminobenzoate synthase component II